MIGVTERFYELMTDLLLKRELSGGVLSEDLESTYAAELERCWWAMSVEDQKRAYESLNDSRIPESTCETEVVDLAVDRN